MEVQSHQDLEDMKLKLTLGSSQSPPSQIIALLSIIELGTLAILVLVMWIITVTSNPFPKAARSVIVEEPPTVQGAALQQEYQLDVQVRDWQNLPVPDARIALENNQQHQWYTNKNGLVSIMVSGEVQKITIFAAGYITQTFSLPLLGDPSSHQVAYYLKMNPMLTSSHLRGGSNLFRSSL